MGLQLLGIHHVTAITADAARNVAFYAGVLGLRLVKKTVNYDAPEVYHLYYGDEAASPGSLITFFEFPDAAAGTRGAGAIHTVTWRVPSLDALTFWERRLGQNNVAVRREGSALLLNDPDGMGIALLAMPDCPDQVAAAADVPADVALHGIQGVAAQAVDPLRSRPLLHVMGFDEGTPASYRLGPSGLVYDIGEAVHGQGAGSVHHVAWGCRDEDQAGWRERVLVAGMVATPVIDRTYFHSIYFREPSGVLFEIATLGPGFAVDEPPDQLGQNLVLPPRYEPLRSLLTDRLTPITNPRGGAAVG